MTPADVVWEMEPHTKAKHLILEEYLKAWFPILGQTTGRIIYLDGFAGPGVYKGGEPGSPVIAIKTAKEHVLIDRFRAELVFLFIEKDKERAKHLRSVLESQFPDLPNDGMKYEVITGDFATTVNLLLRKIEDEGAQLAPTFAFLDPFGFSGLPMSLIARLLSYNKCEVLITFMVGFVNRFCDELRSDALKELYGTSDWEQVRFITNPEERRKFLLELYVRQLRSVGGAVYVRSFDMYNKHNQLIYSLVFGTKHLKGLKVMKEAMWKADERGTYTFYDTTDPRNYTLLRYGPRDSWMEGAADIVYEHFRGKTVRVEEIEEFVWTETPYLFRKGILRKLESEVNPRIISVSGRKKRGFHPKGCVITFSD